MMGSSKAQWPVSPLSGREVTGSMPGEFTLPLVRPIRQGEIIPKLILTKAARKEKFKWTITDKNRETNKKISSYRM